MPEIKIQVPDNVPIFCTHEEDKGGYKGGGIKWALFEKAKEEIELTMEELEELERIRDEV
ncbi:hypothetical protein [Pyrococcus kukulkanii]|uniref:hypothetical protein n=1 Tax=Pyrococcus kukulkanii TaxID=1609559 RepID=UPI00356A3CCD